MAFTHDGNFGDGDFGQEYYSATINDTSAGPTIVSAASLSDYGRVVHVGALRALGAIAAAAAGAAIAIRTAGASLLAVSGASAAGRKLWEPEDAAPEDWSPLASPPQTWMASPAAGPAAGPAVGPDPWSTT
jgi:hypothetical protein